MEKINVFEALREKLEGELNLALGASRDAADYATNEESRADSKYDTQGLEASYLAAGQASLAREMAEAVGNLNSLREELILPREKVMRGALVKCDLDGFTEWFFICPVGGGETIEFENTEVTILTGHSPLGAKILGKSPGTAFTLPNGSSGRIIEIL